MLINFIYESVLFLLVFLGLPKFLYQWIFHKKYRKSLRSRFGGDFPEIDRTGKQVIWIHAVSVGETLAVSTLAKRCKEETPNALLIISTTSETGQAEARRSLPFADHFVYLPFDFFFVVDPILKSVRPDVVILCESDFWFNFMRTAKKYGAAIALVNGKLSPTSTKRFQWFPPFTNQLFGLIDHFFIQNQEYDSRFAALGIPADKRTVTGNMKFDVRHLPLPKEEREELKHKLGLQQGELFLVVGSCHDPEEQLVLDALKPLWSSLPHLKVLFVPRHPERFSPVLQILQKQNMPLGKFSEAPLPSDTRLILMDSMGLLRKCYQLADLAIVAGSFTPKVGGHNITEPCWYGVPVLYGPNMHTQKELVGLMKQYGSGIQVNPEVLSDTLHRLLSTPQERQALGANGLKLVADAHGATEKTWQGIERLFLKGSSVEKKGADHPAREF